MRSIYRNDVITMDMLLLLRCRLRASVVFVKIFHSGFARMIIISGSVTGASFQLFLGGAKFFSIIQCHRTIEILEKTALYM